VTDRNVGQPGAGIFGEKVGAHAERNEDEQISSAHIGPEKGRSQTFKVAAIQLNSQSDTLSNRLHATRLIREAAAAGAQFICTPEYTNVLRRNKRDALAVIHSDDCNNPDLIHYGSLAKELGIWLNVGSMAVKLNSERMANRSFLINSEGTIVARYDKIHMFDVDLPDGKSFRESELVTAGDCAVVANTPFGRMGLNICYDIRFPEQQKAEAQEGGATILLVPAAYSIFSGQRTWETFLRARAAENACYIIASGQCGSYENGEDGCWGDSMIVSPWGTVVARSEHRDKAGIVVAEIDLFEVDAARTSYPVRNEFRSGRVAMLG
jgi:predicted amidohydrolase